MRIREVDRPMASDDIETAQTVSYMDELAAHDACDPAIANAAHDALDQAGIGITAPAAAIAAAIYYWLQREIRYVPTPGTSPLVDQTLIPPCTLLAMPEPIGDCPQFSMAANAMLRYCGINSLFVTIAANSVFPDQWSHIYNTVEVLPGRWMPFDSSNGPAPGAEYAKPFKRRVWPRLTPDQCNSTQGNPAMMRQSHASPRGMRSRSLRGALGDTVCDASGDCYDDGSYGDLITPGVSDPTDCLYGANIATGGCNPAPQVTTSPIGPTTSNTPGGNPYSLASQLAAEAAQIAAPIVRSATQQTPYYVTDPATGQAALYNPNTGTFASAATAIGSINPTYLLFGALAIGAIALMGGKK